MITRDARIQGFQGPKESGDCATVCRDERRVSHTAGGGRAFAALVATVIAFALAGCGAAIIDPDGGDASTTGDGGTVTCAAPGGARVAPGTRFAAADGCNTCICDASGTAACTLLACTVTDSGTVTPPSPGCASSNGWLPPGTSYSDGCNTCTCLPAGGGYALACTALACVDGGFPPPPQDASVPPSDGSFGCFANGQFFPPGSGYGNECTQCTCLADGTFACSSSSDCGGDGGQVDGGVIISPPAGCNSSRECASGEECVGEQGCGIPWRCEATGRACTADIAPYCSCSGNTVYGSSSCPPGPYQYRGSCDAEPPPVDAGVPDGGTVDAGAIECRQYAIACRRLPPTCDFGMVPSVDPVSRCWGDCVSLNQCPNLACSFGSGDARQCPYGTTCLPSNRCDFVRGL